MTKTNWSNLIESFSLIINNNNNYKTILNNILISTNNTLIYSHYGFPIDLIVEVALKKIFKKEKDFYRTSHVWNKSINYKENQYFIEIDLMNPENIKNLDKITKFLLHIICSKDINMNKHFVIIKHIDILSKQFFDFRILLEKYSDNITFLCTTHHIYKIEPPIKSRFHSIRIPLFSHEEINDIFDNYLKTPLHPHLCSMQTRDIVKAIFIADVGLYEAGRELITNEFIEYNFLPFIEFIKTYNKSVNNLEEIRILSYRCCQYNISIFKITQDFVKLVDYEDYYIKIKYNKIPKKNYEKIKRELKINVVNIGTHIDYLLSQTNKCKEPIYIEKLLCFLLL
jgi:hypothetical protein